jgi:hypothetical protein
MVSTLLVKRYHLWKKLGFCLTLNAGTTLKVYLEASFSFQAISNPSAYTLNVIIHVDANNWPTSHCGWKVRRLLVFKLTQ